jgi:hypothetical protein
MPAIVPHRFLVRMCHPVVFHATMPLTDEDQILDLPPHASVNNFAQLDGAANFADVRLAWNELGLGVQVVVRGKKQPLEGSSESPRSADGLTLWIDTRSDRTSHRASRYCHQFFLLPNGGEGSQNEPWLAQVKIHRALQDSPLCSPTDVPFRAEILSDGYRLDAFFSSSVLTGYDPDQHPRMGIYYHVRDQELGDQYLSVNGDFPFADDPSLWATIDLTKPQG